MKNKLISAGLVAALCLSLAGCGSSSGNTSSTSTSGETTATSGSGVDLSTSGAAFKLGGSGPLSGDASVYGIAVKNAAELAISEINAKGGVQFEFNFQDDQADTEAAVNAYNQLADWGMQLSLGTVTSGSGQSVSPNYKEDNIFAISPSASSTAVIYQDAENNTNPYGNIFQMCFTDPNQGTASADYLAEHTELGSKIGIIYRNDDNYSTGIYNNFVKEAEAKNLEIVSTGTFTKGATDFSVQIKQAQDAGADILFIPIYYQPASLILQAAKSANYTPTFFGCDGMDGILTQDNFDTSLAEGLYMLTPFSADADDEKTQNFVKAYEEAYGDTPNQFAADAYDAVYALAQALEASDVTPESSTDDITAALIEQFTSMTFQGITADGDITWNENGEVSKQPRAIVIKDGTYVSAE